MHQDPPEIEQKRLDAIEEAYNSLTEDQRKYLQYQIVQRSQLLIRVYQPDKTPHLDPEGVLMLEMSHINDNVNGEIEALMVRSKEDLAVATAK